MRNDILEYEEVSSIFVFNNFNLGNWPNDAQFPEIDRQSGGSFNDFEQSEFGSQEDFENDLDTFGVFYFFAENPNIEFTFSDSLLDNFQQYDPARKLDVDYRHLGNLGSAHQYLLYQPLLRKGFDVGLHQFDLYQTTANQLPYYRLEKAYTNVAYVQGAEQADGYFTGDFSRNFANGLNFTLDFKKISQLSRRSQYPNQNTRTTALGLGMWYHSKNERYDGFFAYMANTIEQEDNGGIETEPQESGEFGSPNSADVFLVGAQSRYINREASYKHYYKFGGQTDSLKGIRRAYTISHQISYTKNVYKFFNEVSASDTSFYFRFPQFEVDHRGMRNFIQHQKIENSVNLSTFKLGETNDNDARNQRDLFEIGLTHSYHILDQEPADNVINNLFVNGRWRLNPGPRLRLDTYAHFGLLDNSGDYRISGELFVDLKKLGNLTVNAHNQLYSPNLIQDRFYVTEQKIWDNDFEKTLETNIAGTYSLPQFNFSATGQYHLISNYIYFDTLGTPQQTGVPISVLQLIVRKNFKVWYLHLDNTIALQESSESEIRVPRIFSKHSFYYAGKWFKVLNIRLGFDMRFNDRFASTYYNPVTGQFQLQDDRLEESYPAVDAFISLRVEKFRAFFKYENLSSSFITDRLYYQTAYYPFPTGAIRFGIKWRLVN